MDIAINLLPWRQLNRKKEIKKLILLVLASVGLGLIGILLSKLYLNIAMNHQMQRNDRLQQEITVFNRQIQLIKKYNGLNKLLFSRITAIQNWRRSEGLTARFFDELVQIIPRGIYLTKIERTGEHVTVFGVAKSNAQVSIMMRSLAQSSWCQSSRLAEIRARSKSAAVNGAQGGSARRTRRRYQPFAHKVSDIILTKQFVTKIGLGNNSIKINRNRDTAAENEFKLSLIVRESR